MLTFGPSNNTCLGAPLLNARKMPTARSFVVLGHYIQKERVIQGEIVERLASSNRTFTIQATILAS